MGSVEIDVNELREENLDNYKNNIDTETPVFYVDNVPFKSANLRKQLFEPHKHKTKIRGAVVENLSPDERNRMELMTEFNQIVYDRRKAYGRDFFEEDTPRKAYKDVPNQNVRDYRFEETDNDLTGLFVNDEEAVLVMRGLLPFHDKKDLKQALPMTSNMLFETESAYYFGSRFRDDKRMLTEEYIKVKKKYPDKKIVVSGHSRGSMGSIYLGRKYNLEFHAFSPVGNRADFVDSIPSEKGHLYYHHNDPVSAWFHRQQGKTVEQHFTAFNNKLYPHSVNDFKDENTKIVKHDKLNPREIDEFEKELMLDMQTKNEDVIKADEYVDSDLGEFSRIDYNPDEDPKKQNTIALNGDNPLERKIFNEYIPSVFNDLNLKRAKPFEPMNFDYLDEDGDNKISFEEFKKHFKKRGYDDVTLKKMFNEYDIDNNNNLSRSEFNILINNL